MLKPQLRYTNTTILRLSRTKEEFPHTVWRVEAQYNSQTGWIYSLYQHHPGIGHLQFFTTKLGIYPVGCAAGFFSVFVRKPALYSVIAILPCPSPYFPRPQKHKNY